MTFGLFNVIVAIYVENTVAAAKFNDLKLKRMRMQNQHLVAEKLHELVEVTCELWEKTRCLAEGRRASRGSFARRLTLFQIDPHDHGSSLKREMLKMADEISITPHFMDELRDDPRVVDIFKALDIASEDTQDLFDTLDVDGGGTIDIKEMILGLCKLRGDASRSDIVGVKLVVRNIQTQISSLADTCQRLVEIQDGQIQAISGFLAPRKRLSGSQGSFGGSVCTGSSDIASGKWSEAEVAEPENNFRPLQWAGRSGSFQQKAPEAPEAAVEADEDGCFEGIRSV